MPNTILLFVYLSVTKKFRNQCERVKSFCEVMINPSNIQENYLSLYKTFYQYYIKPVIL